VNKVQLVWEDKTHAISKADGYKLSRCPSTNSGNWGVIYEAPASERSYEDTSVSDGTDYQYQLAAYNSRGETLSKIILVTTPKSK
jgi:hypothetical protein